MSNTLREDIIRLSGQEIIDESFASVVSTVITIASVLSNLSVNKSATVTTNSGKTYQTPTNQIEKVLTDNPAASVEVETTLIPKNGIITSIEYYSGRYYLISKDKNGEELYKECVGKPSSIVTSQDIKKANENGDNYIFTYTSKCPASICLKYEKEGWKLKKVNRISDREADMGRAQYIQNQLDKYKTKAEPKKSSFTFEYDGVKK